MRCVITVIFGGFLIFEESGGVEDVAAFGVGVGGGEVGGGVENVRGEAIAE